MWHTSQITITVICSHTRIVCRDLSLLMLSLFFLFINFCLCASFVEVCAHSQLERCTNVLTLFDFCSVDLEY